MQRIAAVTALILTATLLAGCVYDPYTGTYVPCCGYYGYPYRYPYYRYPYYPYGYYGAPPATYPAPPPNRPGGYGPPSGPYGAAPQGPLGGYAGGYPPPGGSYGAGPQNPSGGYAPPGGLPPHEP